MLPPSPSCVCCWPRVSIHCFPCFIKESGKGDQDLGMFAAFVYLGLGLRCLNGMFPFSHGKVLLFGSKPGAYWCMLFLVIMLNHKWLYKWLYVCLYLFPNECILVHYKLHHLVYGIADQKKILFLCLRIMLLYFGENNYCSDRSNIEINLLHCAGRCVVAMKF